MDITLDQIKGHGPDKNWYIIDIKREGELDQQPLDRIEICYPAECAKRRDHNIKQEIKYFLEKKGYKLLRIYEEVQFIDELPDTNSEMMRSLCNVQPMSKRPITERIITGKIVPFDCYVIVIENNPLEKEWTDTPF